MFESNLLKKSEVKILLDKISQYYNCDISNLENYNFYFNEKNDKIYISTYNVEELGLDRVSNHGLYFGSYHDNGRFRLSIEGSKFVIPNKNYVKISPSSLKSYVAGENLFADEVLELNYDENAPFLVVIYDNGEQFENVGSISVKENFLLNYVPKSRRLDFNKIF